VQTCVFTLYERLINFVHSERGRVQIAIPIAYAKYVSYPTLILVICVPFFMLTIRKPKKVIERREIIVRGVVTTNLSSIIRKNTRQTVSKRGKSSKERYPTNPPYIANASLQDQSTNCDCVSMISLHHILKQ
jgi:hypothetical protein